MLLWLVGSLSLLARRLGRGGGGESEGFLMWHDLVGRKKAFVCRSIFWGCPVSAQHAQLDRCCAAAALLSNQCKMFPLETAKDIQQTCEKGTKGLLGGKGPRTSYYFRSSLTVWPPPLFSLKNLKEGSFLNHKSPSPLSFSRCVCRRRRRWICRDGFVL